MSFICVLQNAAVVGFCFYKIGFAEGPKEVWIAIIASVVGCVSKPKCLFF